MTLEQWVNRLASQVLQGETLRSFLALDLKARLVGIATFAKIGGETKVLETAMAALAQM